MQLKFWFIKEQSTLKAAVRCCLLKSKLDREQTSLIAKQHILKKVYKFVFKFHV